MHLNLSLFFSHACFPDQAKLFFCLKNQLEVRLNSASRLAYM